MNKDILFKKLNDGTIEERLRAFKINLNKNLKYIKKHGGLKEIVPLFADKKIIVVGAGPSLQDKYNLLKRIQHRKELIIISTDMALLPLTIRGIFPEYVISCETTPVDYFSQVQTSDMRLLAFSCISNTNLRKWQGSISFYNWMIQNDDYSSLWNIAGNYLGFVATGSIVTTQAISFVLGCNIQSLMLLGNDMGFGKEYYVKDTVVYPNIINNSTRVAPVETKEFNAVWKRREYVIHRGEKVYFTNNQFLASKMWLEDLFNNIDIPIYECNDLGCSNKFVQKISIQKYLEQFERKPKRKRR